MTCPCISGAGTIPSNDIVIPQFRNKSDRFELDTVSLLYLLMPQTFLEWVIAKAIR
jgi:hypothetical protein